MNRTGVCKIIGVDLSLTSTGVALIRPGVPGATATDVIRLDRWKRKAPQTDEERVERMRRVLDEVDLWTLRASLVVFEGLAFDAHDNRRQGAGLAWLARTRHCQRGTPFATIPPSNLKQYATGRGNATKADMLAATAEHFPGVEVEDDNAADALWLADAGARWLGMPLADLPDGRSAFLDGATWPTLGIAA